jgi:UDP-GlcNAc:undecaprenyl-phosphate GlcNAc-1-phosphate transferase
VDSLAKVRAYPLAFLLALCCTALLVPIVRRVALRVGAVSRPGGRNVNAKAIPRLGGIAIAVGFVIPLLTIFPAESAVASVLRSEWTRVVGLAVGGLFITVVGVWDDTRRLRALHKLAAQVAAATLAYFAGFRLDAISVPWVGTFGMGVFGLPVTVVWVVGIVNAVNLIDGLDGLAAGIAFFAALTNFVVGYLGNEMFVPAIMSTLLGALLGFLFFNFNPARIFMGDSGSYFLGFVLGTMSLAGTSQKTSTAVSLLVPVLALGVPIFDTLFAVLRRILERRPIFSSDRGHIHHRLLDMGLTHRRVVLILYAASLILTCAAIGVSLGTRWTVGLALLGASVVVAGLIRSVGYFEYMLVLRRRRARLRTEDTERIRGAFPEIVRGLSAAGTEGAVFRVLEETVAKAGLHSIELVAPGADEALRKWSRAPEGEPIELASARYPLGGDSRARSHLRFRWSSDNGEVDAQAEVLLQVVSDMVSLALLRTGSLHAPLGTPIPIAPGAALVPAVDRSS